MTTTRPDRRIAERRKAVVRARVQRRRRRLAGALGLVAAVVGGAALARTPLFALTSVRVEGTRELPAAAVVAAAEVRPGDPYLLLDLGAVRRRVETLPWVDRAEVGRDYPSSVRIEVTERVPAAVVKSSDRWWLVAADGMVLDARAERPGGVPFVAEVPLPGNLRVGSRLKASGPLANALAALGGMRTELRAQVTGVRARSLDSLTFTLEGGTRLLYGLADEQPAKDAAALIVLGQLEKEQRRAAQIDVRIPTNPTVMPGT